MRHVVKDRGRGEVSMKMTDGDVISEMIGELNSSIFQILAVVFYQRCHVE